jgi:hypothetical protein
MAAHPVLIRAIWQDFVLGFVHADNARIAQVPFSENRYAAFDKIKHPDAWMQIGPLPSLSLENSIAICDAARRDPYVNFWRPISLMFLAICTILTGGAACVINRKIPRMVLVGCCALATGILVFLTCMLGVFYQDRYTLPLLITVVFGLLASLASYDNEEQKRLSSEAQKCLASGDFPSCNRISSEIPNSGLLRSVEASSDDHCEPSFRSHSITSLATARPRASPDRCRCESEYLPRAATRLHWA